VKIIPEASATSNTRSRSKGHILKSL